LPPWSPFLSKKQDTEEIHETKKDFRWYLRALEKYGVYSGTAHKRILIPKSDITQEELEEQLGFIPVSIAIPEAGQKSFTSYRHPYSTHHLHEFAKYWTIHRDEHEASTMILHRNKDNSSILEKTGHFLSGLPHVITEGIPGAFYYTKGLLTSTEPMDVRLGQELPDVYLNRIKGFQQGGLSARLRGDNTDFDNGGYQGNQQYRGNFAFPASIGAGVGIGLLTYRSVFNPFDVKNISKYKRLEELRRIGTQHGFRMVSTNIPEFFDEKIPAKGIKELGYHALGYTLFGEMNPTRHISELRGFSGVAYIQSGEWAQSQFPISTRVANWGSWDIGADKLSTWKYFEEKGIGGLHAKSIAASEFYQGGKLSDIGRSFIEEAGGLENIVVKHRTGARGTGVWMNAAELPSEIAENMYRNSASYMLQQKLDLAEEFRVVTVGDKPIHTTYRFGSKTLRQIGKLFGITPTKEKVGAGKVASVSPFEVIQPVWNKKYREGVEQFAEQVARNLPYEIGALDIGMTKEGKFLLIEAQRSFGNISNPIVSRRIKQLITGKAGPGAIIASSIIGGIAGALINNHFSAKDDEYNTIEGMRHGGMAGEMRKENTDFGSGWKGWFGKIKNIFSGGGISRKISRYMATGMKEGAETLLHPAQAFELSKGKSLEQFAEALGEKALIIRTPAQQEWFAQQMKVLPGLAGGAAHVTFEKGEAIVINPALLREQFLKTAVGTKRISQETALKAVESETFLHSVLYHEILEKQTAAKFSSLRKMPAQHNAAQVLIGEGGFIRFSNDSNLEALMSAVRFGRSEEKAAYLAGLEAFSNTGNSAKLRNLITDFSSRKNSQEIAMHNIIKNKRITRFHATSHDLRRSQVMLWNNAKYGARGHTFKQGK